jgi:hypothetical protein
MSKVNIDVDARLEPDGSLVCHLDFEGRKAKVIFGGPPNMDVVFETVDEPRGRHEAPDGAPA